MGLWAAALWDVALWDVAVALPLLELPMGTHEHGGSSTGTVRAHTRALASLAGAARGRAKSGGPRGLVARASWPALLKQPGGHAQAGRRANWGIHWQLQFQWVTWAALTPRRPCWAATPPDTGLGVLHNDTIRWGPLPPWQQACLPACPPQAVLDRDPACSKYSQCMLYFKGFQAVQCYRVTHWLWKKGRKVGRGDPGTTRGPRGG